MMQEVKVNILGVIYTVKRLEYSEDPSFEKEGSNGYCEPDSKTIVVGDLSTFKDYKDSTREVRKNLEMLIARHEVVHAFLFESGLRDSSMVPTVGWSMNEEMVEWFAIQGPKIVKVWKELRVLED